MAKEKNGKSRWIGLGLSVIGMLAMVIGSFVWAQADIKAVDVKADNIEIAITQGLMHMSARHKEDNTATEKELETLERNKVEKEIFQMYIASSEKRFDASQQVIKEGIEEIKGRLTEIEKK